MKNEREEWRNIGRREGYEELAGLLHTLMDNGQTEEVKRVLSNHEYREKLCQEYVPNISNTAKDISHK